MAAYPFLDESKHHLMDRPVKPRTARSGGGGLRITLLSFWWNLAGVGYRRRGVALLDPAGGLVAGLLFGVLLVFL